MRTGFYTLYFHKNEIEGEMLLEYEASSSQTVTSPINTSTQMEISKASKERWTSEQIGDFVRKLGFMDKDENEENGEGIIKRFLHINQV